RPKETIVLDHGDELTESLVQLNQKKTVERNAAVEQQHERVPRHIRDRALAHRDTVIAASLALQQRPFTKPSSRGNADEADGSSLRRYGNDLYKATQD